MKAYNIYVDGSFMNGDIEAHGGIVMIHADNKTVTKLHVKCMDKNLTSMRNIGGEILAAYCAIYSVAANLDGDEKCMINLAYDYTGIEMWLTHKWATKRQATEHYVRKVSQLLREHKGLRINFKHIPGHTGEVYNEMADEVAKFRGDESVDDIALIDVKEIWR